MASLNRVLLLGNLTRDPVLRYASTGTPIATLSLAVSAWRADDPPCYIDITVFGNQAEPCSEYLTKGQAVLVEGSLRYRTWEGQDGARHAKHEVVAQHVEFLSKPKAAAEDGDVPAPSPGKEAPAPVEDEVPF